MSNERIGILISGRGSNMVALIDACQAGHVPATATVVISNIAGAAGLEKARERGVATVELSHRGLPREEHDRLIIAALKEHHVTVVCLAGYMRLISPAFIRAYPDRILNIHPSLLPAFPGLDAQQQAIQHGAKVSGCTVHLVDEELDHGPIVMQQAVVVDDDDTVDTLSARILEQEHKLYPKAVARVLSPGFKVSGRRTSSPSP